MIPQARPFAVESMLSMLLNENLLLGAARKTISEVNTHMYTLVNTQTHKHTYAHTHKHIKHINTPTHPYTHKHIKHINTLNKSHKHTHKHVTHINTLINTQTHKHTHKHTNTQVIKAAAWIVGEYSDIVTIIAHDKCNPQVGSGFEDDGYWIEGANGEEVRRAYSRRIVLL